MGTARYDLNLTMERLYPSPGIGLCAWCWTPVPKGRRRWCSDRCSSAAVHEYLILKGHSDTVRAAVFKRDRGVCARCGKDTELERRVRIETRELWRWLARRKFEEDVRAGFLKQVQLWQVREVADRAVNADLLRTFGTFNVYGHAWEANHIVPVVEGGGGCGLQGYETLCIPCHRLDTAALAARRAALRRAQK